MCDTYGSLWFGLIDLINSNEYLRFSFVLFTISWIELWIAIIAFGVPSAT